MKTIIFIISNLILSFWGNLMEEISKLEFSREGFYIIGGIITVVVIGLIAMTIKERIEKKQEKAHPPTPPSSFHHHQHHRRRRH